MKFTINALDGEARFASFGSFTFEGLTEWEEGGGDWDYRVVDDSVVNGMQTYSIRLGGNGFNNINTDGATNLMIIPPNDIIVAISEGHYSIKPSYIDKVYDVGSPEPADFNLGRYEYYYTINTRSSTDQSVKFDEFNLVGTNGWDSSIKHYKITALSQVLFRPSQNCFGVGTRLSFQGSGESSIRIKADYTILNRFLGTYGEWALTANNQWSPRKGGVLNGTTMFSNEPWDYVSYSAETLVKAPFSVEEVADGNLPVLPEFKPKSGFYLVDLEYNDEPLIGIVGILKNAEGVITDASIWACTREFFTEGEAPPYLGPKSDVEGGGGTFTAHPGSRDLADTKAKIDAWAQTAAGFYGGYNKYICPATNMTAFNEFCERLRTPAFLESVENAFMSPIENIICCHAVPALFEPFTLDSRIIVAGSANMSQTKAPTFEVPIVTAQTPAMQHIRLDEYYGGFPDYTDTAVYLHLPYIGVVQLDTAACMKGEINIMYACDLISGDVTAFVNVSDRDGSSENRYTYKGNLAKEIPMRTYTPIGTSLALAAGRTALSVGLATLTSGLSGAYFGAQGVAAASKRAYFDELKQNGALDMFNSAEMEQAAAQDVAAARVAGARSGAVNGAIAGISTIGNGIGNALSAGSQTASSNGDSGSFTSPIDTNIWLLVIRPKWSNPTYYGAQNGLTSDLGGLVMDYQGLLATASIDLTGIECTDDERAELEQHFKNGVYVSDPYDAETPLPEAQST